MFEVGFCRGDGDVGEEEGAGGVLVGDLRGVRLEVEIVGCGGLSETWD